MLCFGTKIKLEKQNFYCHPCLNVKKKIYYWKNNKRDNKNKNKYSSKQYRFCVEKNKTNNEMDAKETKGQKGCLKLSLVYLFSTIHTLTKFIIYN